MNTRKKQNVDAFLQRLTKAGFKYETLNEEIAHYRAMGVSFWPTTGKYYDPKTDKKGQGVSNLIKLLSGFVEEDTGENPNDNYLMEVLIQFQEGNLSIEETFDKIKLLAEQL